MRPAALVHVVDDDPAVRDALRWLLEGEGLRVLLHPSAEAFLQHPLEHETACALVDLRMPGMSGLELQEALIRRRSRLPLVFVTAHGDIALAVTAMRRGAVDFVEKPFDDERLVEVVGRALEASRTPPVAPDEAARARALGRALSARERRVLAGVVEGKSSKAIGTELGIATKTVEAHRARIMAKLGATSLAALVRLVVQHGLI